MLRWVGLVDKDAHNGALSRKITRAEVSAAALPAIRQPRRAKWYDDVLLRTQLVPDKFVEQCGPPRVPTLHLLSWITRLCFGVPGPNVV